MPKNKILPIVMDVLDLLARKQGGELGKGLDAQIDPSAECHDLADL